MNKPATGILNKFISVYEKVMLVNGIFLVIGMVVFLGMVVAV